MFSRRVQLAVVLPTCAPTCLISLTRIVCTYVYKVRAYSIIRRNKNTAGLSSKQPTLPAAVALRKRDVISFSAIRLNIVHMCIPTRTRNYDQWSVYVGILVVRKRLQLFFELKSLLSPSPIAFICGSSNYSGAKLDNAKISTLKFRFHKSLKLRPGHVIACLNR